jgi:hypothetical protein
MTKDEMTKKRKETRKINYESERLFMVYYDTDAEFESIKRAWWGWDVN